MWKVIVDPRHGFGLGILPAAGGGTATSGLVRNHHGDAIVERRRQERRLAVARMAKGDDPISVQSFVGHKVIDGPLNAPGPGRDAAPLGRHALGPIVITKKRIDAVVEVGSVRHHVAIIKRAQRVSAIDDLGHRPFIRRGAASGVGGSMVFDARPEIRHPNGRQADIGVVQQAVVSCEIGRHEYRRRLARRRGVGGHDQQIDFRALRRAQRNRDFPARGFAAQAACVAADLGR